MNAAKIQLSSGHNEAEGAGGEPIYHNIKRDWEISSEEQALVANAGWIFTKNAIIAKVLVLFGELSGSMQEQWGQAGWRQDLPVQAILSIPPRISKGENYKGLPWVVLDYPRSFGRHDIFAVRTLFWWGNYFSVTLHLKGKYKELFLAVIRDHIPLLAAGGFLICVSGDEWRHELGQENYRLLNEAEFGNSAGAAGTVGSRGSVSSVEPGSFVGTGNLAEPGSSAESAGSDDPEIAAGPGGTEHIPGRQDFLKFSAKCDLSDWNEAGRLLLQLSGIVIQALTREDTAGGSL